jgi:hypothetical protein
MAVVSLLAESDKILTSQKYRELVAADESGKRRGTKRGGNEDDEEEAAEQATAAVPKRLVDVIKYNAKTGPVRTRIADAVNGLGCTATTMAELFVEMERLLVGTFWSEAYLQKDTSFSTLRRTDRDAATAADAKRKSERRFGGDDGVRSCVCGPHHAL